MYPDLIDLGFLHLKTYGACMAIGFLLCWRLIDSLWGSKELGNLIISLMISGVIGSRLAYVIEHWQKEFAADPMQIIRVDQGGLMFYGGLILAIAVFFTWCLFKKESTLKVADVLCAVIPLGHAFGRLGCFFYGCCYGKDSHAWCAVVFPKGSPSWSEHGHRMVSVLPTQLFEAAALAALFVVTLSLYRKKLASGIVMGAYLAGYALIRFGIEYLRGDPRAQVGIFSISQTISLVMFALGVTLIVYRSICRAEKV